MAIKRIHPHLAQDPVFLEMFFDEATIASRIQHAHVCHVFDLDYQDGQYFLAMEYLLGEPLSRVARALRRLPDRNWERHAALVARIVADACEGLHAAHEIVDEAGDPLDVVHRDVSPENIFLTYDGVVKIVDFGVASASRQLHRTQTGMLKGKYAYLQPEVVDGQRPDRRGDIWGIGVVLWELLTCRRLFNRDTDFDTLRAVTDADIPAPSAVESRLPPELDVIVMKALRRNPDERYATARELGEDLGRFLLKQGEPVSLSHLSEWISELFPGGRARQEQFIEMALQDKHSEAPPPDRTWEETTSLWTPPGSSRPPPPNEAAVVPAPAPALPVLTPAPSAPPVAPPSAVPMTAPPDADTVVAGPSYPEERHSAERGMSAPAERGMSAPAAPETSASSNRETERAVRASRHSRMSSFSDEQTGAFIPTKAFSRAVRSTPSLPGPATWLAGAAIIMSAVAIWSRPAQAERTQVSAAAAATTAESRAPAPPATDEASPEDEREPSPVTLQLPASVFEKGRVAISTPMRLEPGTYVVELRPGEGDDDDWSLELRPTMEQPIVVGTFEPQPTTRDEGTTAQRQKSNWEPRRLRRSASQPNASHAASRPTARFAFPLKEFVPSDP